MASTFTLISDSYEGRYLKLECSQTTDIATNTSTISWTLSSVGGSSNYYATGPTTVIINGTTVYYKARTTASSQTFPAAKGSTSGTIQVKHNNLGDKAIAVSLSTAIFWGAASVNTKSGTWTLDSIPRKATITSAPDFNDDDEPTITFSNPAGNAVEKLEACISFTGAKDDIKYKEITDKTSTSYTFNFTPEERKVLREGVLNGSTSRQVIFYLRTKIDNTYFYDVSYKTLTIVSCVPLRTLWEVSDNNPDTVALTGNSGRLIKGHSTAQYSLEFFLQKEDHIKSVSVVCGSQTREGLINSFANVQGNTFTYNFKGYRGHTLTETKTLSMVNYVDVSCKLNANIELVGETGAKIDVTLSGNYFNGSFGKVNNELFLEYRYKEEGSDFGNNWIPVTEAYTPTFSDNTYSLTFPIENLDYEKTYTIQARARDKLTNDNAVDYIATLIPVFDWGKNDFNFNVPISIKRVEQDYIVEQGEKDGWTYRKWNSGLGECWKILTHTTTLDSPWGSMYCGATLMKRQNYPFVFIEKPVEIVNVLASGNAAWITPESGGNGMNGAYATAVYNVVRPSIVNTSQTFNFDFYIRGRWK